MQCIQCNLQQSGRLQQGTKCTNEFPVALGNSAVFTCIGALSNPSRTGPLARKYLQGFPYCWSLRRLRQKSRSIFCTVICNYPSAAQHKNSPLVYSRPSLLVFVRACSSINNKIISIKKFISPQPVGAPQKEQNPRGPGHVPSVPIG